MNLQQLEYIIAVDQLKSFSKAALHCQVTQATLSAMVKNEHEQGHDQQPDEFLFGGEG